MTAKEIYNALLAAYGKPRWWSDDAFTVMLQSPSTKKMVNRFFHNKVLQNLFFFMAA